MAKGSNMEQIINSRHKCRIYDKCIGEMCYDVCIGFIKDGITKDCVIADTSCGQITYTDKRLNDIEIMQCTGLKDINGIFIYEGDIVKFGNELFGKPKQIEWDECHYILKDTFIILCNMEIKQFNLEVIGNRFENPELIKELEQ